MNKPIHQYDRWGNYIASYPTTTHASRAINCDESSLRKPLRYNDPIKVKDHYFSYNRVESLSKDLINHFLSSANHQANILVIDIETSPTEAFVWGLWKQNVAINQIIEDYYILSYSCKWLLESDIYSSVLTPQEAIMKDDSRLVNELWKFLDSADIIIAYNGIYFDVKVMNTRFLLYGLKPTSTYQVIDPLVICKNQFRFISNKLDYVLHYMGLEGKRKHEGFEMWSKCIHGDADALREIELYNRADVTGLEDLYMLLRPWIKPHPNIGLFIDDKVTVCPTCGSSKLSFNGYYHTPMNRYEEFRCEDCGAIGRSRFAKKKFKGLLSSVPR